MSTCLIKIYFFISFLDAKLAVEVGLLLLRNNKELEAVLQATERQYEEEKSRADVRNGKLILFRNLGIYSHELLYFSNFSSFFPWKYNNAVLAVLYI